MNGKVELAFENAEGALAFVCEHFDSFVSLAASPNHRGKVYLFADSLRCREGDCSNPSQAISDKLYWHFTAGLLELLVEVVVEKKLESANG